MADVRSFTVRPVSKQARADYKDAFRIYLSSSSLASLRLRADDLCDISFAEGPPKTAIAWTATENIQSTVVQTSKALQDCYGIKVGGKINITRIDGPLEELKSVVVIDCSEPEKIDRFGQISAEERCHWEWALEFPLLRCEVIAKGLIFELELRGQRRSFQVVNMHSESPSSSRTIFRFTSATKISIGTEVEAPSEIPYEISVDADGLGGLSRQIDDINESLSDFNIDLLKPTMPSFYEHSRGILLYGPKGTGKTSLLQQIEKAGWRQVFKIGTATLGRSTGEAEKNYALPSRMPLAPSPLDFIAPKRTSLESSSLASVLCENLDAMRSASVLVIAATRHPNNVDDALRTPHRFGTEIEIQVPTALDRAEILRAIRGPASAGLTDAMVDLLAEKTHGYVGADLFALLQLICRKARQRQMLEQKSVSPSRSQSVPASDIMDATSDAEENGPVTVDLAIQESDIWSSLQEIRPTAMREVFLETPKVRWSDIGGQHDIKKRLQQAVERPLKFPERMKRLNVKSKKGVLLYGPPGCSKTLTVKALATEAGLNFLAVKGAEILSMYVGESERSLREIFRKARAARPSIIFFDEIDAIAARRSSTSSGGVNVLTTLLNEMDGIEELRNVLVVAATNKPDVLDPALMRPGRLDNILYIGPPDFEARKEILRIWASKSVIHPDVDLEELAAHTEGYSGAEIVSICETAGDAALDEEEETQQELEVQLKHFEYALGQVHRQITDSVIREYEQWRDGQK
ncbi:ATPase [Penicillium frequentans]|uniref:ATPase n=1 Tax=Penicillium frequentans TaxID=3151616 RepID=A0AAD6GCL0_9EURO|nr:ATPase [Penicillium glabrum]